ncbi:GGDEF domain-containing protein [Sporosarcina aquimarina]|uniref:Diguanylate cyclase n=1 Tax=Sporosarcina aquimarina TaxID=114975 RepID=A0ABU4FXP2_9BACL|nr:diguanylate cyclase [Sporosarcina aquimarina]MDW0108848.1 diguanylate cyclase [Sporosarcina aquimarina]
MNEQITQLQERMRLNRMNGSYKEMIETSYQLLRIAKQTNNQKLEMDAYANYALGFYAIGDCKDAFHYMELHADLCEQVGDAEDYMKSYHVFHLLYDYTENYDMAKTVLEKSISLADRLGKDQLVSENCSALSGVLSRMNDYDEALRAGKKAARIAALHDPYCPSLVLKAILAIANACLSIGKLEDADLILHMVMKDPVIQVQENEKMKCYRLAARLHVLQNDLEAALESLKCAKESALKTNNYKYQKEIHEEQIELYQQLEMYKEGFEVQQQQIQLLQQLHQQETANAALELEMKMKLQELERVANTDFLTNVSNRRALELTANEWLLQADRVKENVVCIAFDIDNLKLINDEFGHPFGDYVIQCVAQTCNDLLRCTDKTGRIGGDEFVAILRGISIGDACRKAHDMLDAVTNLIIEQEGKRVPVSLSVGVAESRYGDITEYATLYRHADSALYQAKNSGKSQVCCRLAEPV